MRQSLGVALGGKRLGRRAVTQVIVARQASRGRQVGLAGPEAVIRFDRGHGIRQPLTILVAPVDAQQHLSQEGRLRAREVIRAVGVQDLSVVADLVQEIVGHILGQRDVVIAQQAKLDEIAVPAVHFIEASAGHDVGPRQIEQALIFCPSQDLRGIAGQLADFNSCEIGRRQVTPQRGLNPRHVLVGGNVNGPTAIGQGFELGIDGGRRQITVRPGQHTPHLADIILNRFRLLRGGRLRGEYRDKQGREKAGDEIAFTQAQEDSILL